jgi:hypothetical protein
MSKSSTKSSTALYNLRGFVILIVVAFHFLPGLSRIATFFSGAPRGSARSRMNVLPPLRWRLGQTNRSVIGMAFQW